MRQSADIEAIYQRPDRPHQGNVLGIDPGPTESAYALVSLEYCVSAAMKGPLVEVYNVLQMDCPAHVVIEGVLLYQRSANHVRETAYVIGRIQRECERLGLHYTMVDRPTYVTALCGGRGNDSLLRSALELRFGGYGKGEPLAVLRGSTDTRSAFAVAVYWLDCRRLAPRVQAGGSR